MGGKVLTCDNCGKSFYKKDGFFAADKKMLGAAADELGLGLLVSAGKGIARASGGLRNYCSEECKREAEAAKGNSGKKSIIGEIMDDSNAIQERQERERQERNEFKEISEIQINGTAEEIQFLLNNLVSKAAGLNAFKKPVSENKFLRAASKVGSFLSVEDQHTKKMVGAIKEKLEFGIMKLRSMKSNSEADYFQEKLDKMK